MNTQSLGLSLTHADGLKSANILRGGNRRISLLELSTMDAAESDLTGWLIELSTLLCSVGPYGHPARWGAQHLTPTVEGRKPRLGGRWRHRARVSPQPPGPGLGPPSPALAGRTVGGGLVGCRCVKRTRGRKGEQEGHPRGPPPGGSPSVTSPGSAPRGGAADPGPP